MGTRKKTTKRVKPQYVRAKKRKGADSSALTRRAITVVLLIVVLFGIGFGIKQGFGLINRKLFSENPTFEIQRLEISCDGKLSEEHIREYTGLAEGMNLFEVSFGEIQDALERVPAVESVLIERSLPHTLIMKVKERVPVARITGRQAQRFPFVVDRYGYVLPPKSSSSLPLIKGLDVDLRLGMPVEHPDVHIALSIIALCDSMEEVRRYIHIETLDVKYDDFIYMHLTGGTRVRMPRHSIRKKLVNLQSLIKIGLARGERYREINMTLDAPMAPAIPY